MADKRTIVEYVLDPTTRKFMRKKILGDEVLENKAVAEYDAESQTVTFPDGRHIREYKVGVMTYCAENELGIRHWQRADIEKDKALSKKVPPRPKKNKLEGDKTEAVVRWYREHLPNEFAARYGYRGTYTGPVEYLKPMWVPRPVDGIPEYRGTEKVNENVVDAIVTDRKTCISFTPDECLTWGDDDGDEEREDRGAVKVGAGEETED